MRTAGLSLDQAPPLSIPASFFLTIPFGILISGYIMFTTPASLLGSPWTPQTLALAHAGTLGVLAMGMAGALYQMIPVIAGTAVPFARLAHGVHVLLVAGLAGFLWGLLAGSVYAMTAAIICFAFALATFLLPVGWALLRITTKDETVRGMRVAVISLAVITLVGLIMARGHAGGLFSVDRVLWMQIHASVALLGWVGGLIMAVSWQVIPMFYLSPLISKNVRRWLFGLLLLGLVLPFGSIFAAWEAGMPLTPGQLAAIGAFPAALVIWWLHPALILRSISGRRRKRSDASLLFWKTGLLMALSLIPMATVVLLLPDPRWQVLFGWLAIWGWAGMILHGMLTRIVPFLVWFHRFSAKVGFETVPSMRSLLSQRRIKLGFVLHSGSALSGIAAIISQTDLLFRMTGILLALTALSLASMLIHVLRVR